MPRKIPYSECHGKGGWYGRTPGLITGIAYWHTCQKCNGHAEFEEETMLIRLSPARTKS